jgi:hypothetical protein
MRCPIRAHRPPLGRLGRADDRPQRPQNPTADDDQQRRQQGDHGAQADGDADGHHRAEALGGVQLGDQQAQQAQDNRGRAGDDGRGGLAQGHGHGLVAVGVAAQLLAVAGGQQQRVVGPGPEHEHGQDERALAVDGQATVAGQQVDDRLGGREGDEHAAQGEQPQHRAAIGDQQDHDHDQGRDVQQGGVEAGEHVGEVGEVAGRPGHVDGEPAGVGLRDGPQLLDPGGELLPAVALRRDPDRHHHLQGPAVGGRDRPEDAAGDVGNAGEAAHIGGHLGLVGSGDGAVGPLVDDQGGEHVAGGEPLGQLDDLGRLGILGQPFGRVVLLGAVELTG